MPNIKSFYFIKKILLMVKPYFISIIESLNKVRKDLHLEAKNLADLSDDMGKVFKPIQIATLLLSVEKVKI